MIPRDVQSWILEQAKVLGYTSPQTVFPEIVSVLDEYNWLRPKTAFFNGKLLLCVFDVSAEVAIPTEYPTNGAFVNNFPGSAPLKDLVAKVFSSRRATPQFTPNGTPNGTPSGTPGDTPGVTPPPVPRKNPLAPQLPQKPPKEASGNPSVAVPPHTASPVLPNYKPAPPAPPPKHTPNPYPNPGFPEPYKPLPPKPYANAASVPNYHPQLSNNTEPVNPQTVNLRGLQLSDTTPRSPTPSSVASTPVSSNPVPPKPTPPVDLMNDSIEPKQLPINNLIEKLQSIHLDYGNVTSEAGTLDSLASELDNYESGLMMELQTHKANLRGIRESTLKARKLIERAPKDEIDMSSMEGIQQVVHIPDLAKETAIASDDSIQRLLDILPKALDSGSFSFEVYMRLVRQFAREQFNERCKRIPFRPPKA